jgi:hypothetical protein
LHYFPCGLLHSTMLDTWLGTFLQIFEARQRGL